MTIVSIHEQSADGSPSDGSPEDDRRALPRRLGDCQLVAHPLDGEYPPRNTEWMLHAAQWTGPLVNISLSAVAFQLDRSVAIGTTLLLRITNPQLGSCVESLGRVERVSTIRDTHIIVCTLTQPLNTVELDSLGWTSTDSFV